MANALNGEKKVAVISALAEGSGIRQIERMTGVHRDTIMRLGVRVGQGCAALLDRKMRDLSCGHLQLDEIWGFIGKKQRNVQPEDNPDYGDVWTFCAIDFDTKLVPSFVWHGFVGVFELIGHPKAPKVYAWSHDTDDPKNLKRHVTVLHVHPIISARDAVRAAIVQEFRSLEPTEES